MLNGLKSLYVCYFGLREPLVQTQVLPYLRELASGGVDVRLLTFEPIPPSTWKVADANQEREKLGTEGITWDHLPYHKSPSVPATLYDIFRGSLRVARTVRREGVDIVHARAHIPLAIAMLARRLSGFALIFDIRGFMAEEYADAGIWSNSSLPFRMVKRLEEAGLRSADQIVVLTRKAREHLASERGVDPAKVTVIPCCVNTGFGTEDAPASGSDRFELVYAGSVTGLYMLPEMTDFFAALKSRVPDAFFRVMTKAEPSAVERVFSAKGIAKGDFLVEAVRPEEVVARMRRARLGISFRKPTFSQVAASPTKVPEYLLAGLPVVTNAGIGDTDEMVRENEVGVIVEGFSAEMLSSAADAAIAIASAPDTAGRCVETANREYSLGDVGGPRYREVYRQIGDRIKGEVVK